MEILLKFKSNSQKIANIKISKIAVKNIRKKRNIKLSNLPITTNTLSLAKDKNIDIVIELIGGSSGVAYKLIRESLKNKKHVITANKALLAVHGNELAQIAEKKYKKACATVAKGLAAKASAADEPDWKVWRRDLVKLKSAGCKKTLESL